MNDSFTFKASLKTTSSQQIFVKAIQTLSAVNKEINILLTPQCMILSTRNIQFSSALKVEFGRQFFDDWYYKPFFLEYGLEGRSDNWKTPGSSSKHESSNSRNLTKIASHKKLDQTVGDCYSFKIHALGVLMKNFAFQKGFSQLIKKETNDNRNKDRSHSDQSGDEILEEGEEDILINKFYDDTGETIDFNNEQEKDSISSMEILLDNTFLCPQTRINKLKIITRNSSGNKVTKTYMPNIIPCTYENYVIEKRYKCRFGAQFLPQLTKNKDPGFVDVFKDLIALYGLENLDVDLKKLNLDSTILNTLKATDADQRKAFLLMPNKEVFEDFENDGVDYSMDDSKLYVNFIKARLSIWRDITDNMSNVNIEDLNMKIDAKQLVIKSTTKTINNINQDLQLQAFDLKESTSKDSFMDNVTSSLLRNGLGVSNSIPTRQLNNTCLALGIDHELTFKSKDFKSFLNLIISAFNTQKLQHLSLLSFLRQQEYKEGRKGLTEKLNNINLDMINFWFADNPGAPIMMEFNLPTIWKAEDSNNFKINGIVNHVRFKMFLLTDYKIAQEKLIQQSMKKKEDIEQTEGAYKEATHPLLQLSIHKREQRQRQNNINEKELEKAKKHLFIDLEEAEDDYHLSKHPSQPPANDVLNDTNEFLGESQKNYPEVHQMEHLSSLRLFEDEGSLKQNQNEFVDEHGERYKCDLDDILDRLEQEKQKVNSGDSLLKDFNKFQSKKRQFIQLASHDGTEEDFSKTERKLPIGEVSSSTEAKGSYKENLLAPQKSLFKGIFEEADEEQREEHVLQLGGMKTTSIGTASNINATFNSSKTNPQNYSEDEDDIGPTQKKLKTVITKGLLD